MPRGEPRTENLNLRLTRRQKRLLDLASAETGTPKSELVRPAVEERIEEIRRDLLDGEGDDDG